MIKTKGIYRFVHNELELNQILNFDEYYLSTAYIEYFWHMQWFVKRWFRLIMINPKHGDENVKETEKNQRDTFDNNECFVWDLSRSNGQYLNQKFCD